MRYMNGRRKYGLLGMWLAFLLVGCAGPDKSITTLAEAKNASIGILTGSTGEQTAIQYFPEADIQRFDFILDAVAAMKAGQLDAAIVARTEAMYVMKHNPGLWYLPEPIAIENSAIALRKGNDSLLQAVNQSISELKDSGVLAEMQSRWFGQDPPYQEADIRVPAGGKPLVVGTNATHEPFCFINAKKEYSGYDVELARRIGVALGRPVVFKDMVFSGLLPALVSGKIDIIISDLTVTEERMKSVDFTQPYFENASVLLVKKQAQQWATLNDSTGNAEVKNTGISLPFLKKIADSFYRNIILENRYLLILEGLKATLVITLFSALLGTLLGAFVCAMRMSRNVLLQGVSKLYIAILRGTPVLVMLMIVYYVVFASVNIDPVLVAIIAFGLNMGAYVSEMFRTGIESVDKGQTEAGISMGFTKVTTFVHIVLPQAIRRIVPVYTGELISQMKMTSVVGYIAVQDLTKAGDIIRSRTFDAFFPLIMVAVLYFLISWMLMEALQYLERKTDPKSQMQRRARHD